jgi:bifunctional non-homologous end joining protein LigD
MLATLTKHRFSDSGWVFERKLDGERCLAFRSGEDVRLLSRNRLRLDANYPEVVAALGSLGCDDFIVDGEIVAVAGGRTSFSRLQQRMKVHRPSSALVSRVPVQLYVFDLLWLRGRDLRATPLRERKRLLRHVLSFGGALRFSSHVNGRGEALFERACRSGWEGVIAKRADGAYVQARSKDWLKFKCENRQELVIAGFTDPRGQRSGFGALLVGYHEGDDLRYAGKVGTGYDERALRSLTEELTMLERPVSPFRELGVPRKGVHWVEPELVAEVAFSEWTRDGKLRHPRFLGLRRDKAPRDVVRERPAG